MTCPGCGLDGDAHATVEACWRGLEDAGRLTDRWDGVSPDGLQRVGPDLPTRLTCAWLRADGREVYPLSGWPPGRPEIDRPDGYYADPYAVDAARRRFYEGTVEGLVVHESLARVEAWLAVRPRCAPGTFVPLSATDGGGDVSVVRLCESTPDGDGNGNDDATRDDSDREPNGDGTDPATLVDSHVLAARRPDRFDDVLFAYDGRLGRRVATAAEDVPARVERRLAAAITTERL